MNVRNYPANWDYIKKLVKKRDNYTCQKCKRKFRRDSPKLHVHHIVPISKGGTDDMSNLITLCEYHHKSNHPHMYVSKHKHKKSSFNKIRRFKLK